MLKTRGCIHMIKIFSIKEIISASESILQTPKKLAEPYLKLRKNIDKAKNIKKKKIFSEIKPLILKSEIQQRSEIIKNNKVSKNIPSKIIDNSKDNNQQIINELFKLFNKKIKKSTLKIIFEQQKEIKKLNKDLSELRKIDYKNLRINKELKNKILDLINNEKILNFKIIKIQDKLNFSLTKEEQLQDVNNELKSDLLEIRKSFTKMNETNIELDNSNSKLNKKIDEIISYQKRINKINQAYEIDISTLTNTKNH